MASELRAVYAVLRVAKANETSGLAGQLDVHGRMSLRSGGAAIVAEGFADLVVDGRPESLWLGSVGPVFIAAGVGAEGRLAELAEVVLDPAEVNQHLGHRGIDIPLWERLSAPRRYESTPELRRWLLTAPGAR